MLVLASACAASSAATLDVYFINVGHGDAILIDCGDWEALLDAGTQRGTPDEEVEAARQRVLAVLDMTVLDCCIDVVILSHPHEDHYGFLDSVFQRFGVLGIWRNQDADPILFRGAVTACPPSLDGSPPEQRPLTFGEQMLTGCLLWTVLGPAEPVTDPDDEELNDNSLVLLLQYGDVSFLLPGDNETDNTIARLHIDLPRKGTVLKLPHHGSDTAVSLDLLKRAAPELAVISGRAADLGGDVLECLGEEGIPFLTTFENGTICVSTDGKAIRVRVVGPSAANASNADDGPCLAADD